MFYFIKIKKEKVATATGRLKALSPTAILSRGYSITYAQPCGEIIKDAAGVKKGARIKTRLAKGEIVSEVE